MSASGGLSGEIRLTGPSGACVVLGNGVEPFHDVYDFVDFHVSVIADGLTAGALVRSQEGDSPRSLHRFLRALADDWKGAVPDRTWEAIEHGLTINASRDAVVHVLLSITLRESYRQDAWRVGVNVQLDAGEEMASLATEVERLLRG